MQILVINPERFTDLAISSLGAIPDTSVYLAVSVADAQRLAAGIQIDVMVCHIMISEELEQFRNLMESGISTVILLEPGQDLSLTDNTAITHGFLVRSGNEMLQKVIAISRMKDANRNLTRNDKYLNKTI